MRTLSQQFTHLLLTLMLTLFLSLSMYTTATQAAAATNTSAVTTQSTSSIELEQQSYDEATYKANLASAGISYTLIGDNLDIFITTKDVLADVPTLEKDELIAKLKPEAIATMPTWISVIIVGIPLTINILRTTYKQKVTVDRLHVHAYIIPLNGTVQQSCYYFDSSRDFIASLTEENSTAKYFLSNAPGFMMDSWCNDQMDKELGQH